MTATTVPPGSRWRSKRTYGRNHEEIVLVVRVTPTDKVVVRHRDGGETSIPISAFLGTFQPDATPGRVCQRCGSTDLRHATDKYCQACQALIGRVRNARAHKQEEEIVAITTTSPTLIEQRHQDAASEPPQATSPAPVPRGKLWRVTGRRVVVEDVDLVVEGATLLDAVAAFDEQTQGAEATEVHLLSPGEIHADS
jgi:hypothetical protein